MKSLLIHIEPMKTAITNRNLKHQHPSWKEAAISFLAKITKNTTKWKQKRAKLILIIAEAPRHADDPPEESGQFSMPPGNQSIMFLAETITRSETQIIAIWKNT